MSSPLQPGSPGQPGPAEPPTPASPSGYGAPQWYGSPQDQGAPQAYGAPQGQGVPQGYAPQGYGAPQPQPGQQQTYGGGPTGELVINLRRPFGAMGMISPVVTIDGFPAASSWGRNSFVVPAGVRQVTVAQSYLWTYGQAAQPVSVQPGRTSEIFYSGPMVASATIGGAIGSEPQKRPGSAVFIGLMVFLGVLLLLVLFAVIVGNS